MPSSRSELETALRRLAPRMPRHEFAAVVDHATHSRGLRAASADTAVWLSVVAYVRHALTEYDQLLKEGYDQASARFFVAAEIKQILSDWGVQRSLSDND